MEDSDETKEARRKKIRELEASLFGGNQQGDLVTGLPELQKVDEYASRYGLAERKKSSALPKLKKQAKEVKKIFFPDPRKALNKRRPNTSDYAAFSDEEDLLESSGSSANSVETTRLPPEDTKPPLPAPLKTPPLQGRKQSTSQHLLKSEVEQLDQSIKHLVSDPKQEVLENIKKRHGLVPRSPSLESNLRSNTPGSLTNVSGYAGDSLGKASILDNPERGRAGFDPSPRRRASIGSLGGRSRGSTSPGVEKAQKILADEQADLERIIQKLDPRFGGPQIPVTTTPDPGNLTPEWPTMPDIKASLTIKGARKDSLQPLPAKTKKDKKSKKRFSLTNPLGRSTGNLSTTPSPVVGHDFTNINPLEDSLSKASKLPAIGNAVPKIKVDNSPRPRRDPRNERTQPDLTASFGSTKSNGSSSGGSVTGMVNFDGLERPFSAGPDDTFKDVPTRTLEDVPDAFDNMDGGTFDGIPTDVFDAIPSAVSAREEQRIKRLQEEMTEKRAAELKLAAEKKQEKEKSEQAAAIYLAQRTQEGDQVLKPTEAKRDEERSPSVGDQPVGAVSLITALFPNAVAAQQQQDQMESDFMFALFIQEKEQTASSAPNPGRPSYPRPSAPPAPSAPPPIPRPDPNDPDVGHFCAPFLDGFCEANFCIYHAPATESKRVHSAAAVRHE